jgi:signal transduction histidine kinase
MMQLIRSFFACCICLLFFCEITCSQSFTKEDSLKSVIAKSSTPEGKLKNVLVFCDEWESINPDTLKTYSQLAKQLAIKQNDKHALLLADYYIAAWLFQVNKIDTALALTEKTINAYKKDFSYDDVLAKLVSLKSNILIRTDHISEMMNTGFDFIKMAEEHKDTANRARAMFTIGNANMRLKKYDETLSWYRKGLQLLNNPVYKQKLSFIYNNIAIVFYHLDREDSATYYVQQGITYSQQAGNLTSVANAYFLYGGLLAEYKHISEAEAAFKKAIGVRQQIGDIYYLISDMAQLALFYCDNNQPQKGIALCNEGLNLLKKNGNDFSNQSALYEVLAKAYLQAKDYKNYSGALQQQLNLKDSIYQKNSAEDMAEMQAKYDLQKRENVIMQQQFDITKKNYLLMGSLILLLVVIIAAYFILREYQRRQKIKTAIMLQEEKRKADEAIVEAEDAERKRIAADLHDNLGTYAASIASNIDNIQLSSADKNSAAAMQELRINSQSIVSQLSDTIWVLKKDKLPLTAISDRLKNLLQRSYPDIQTEVLEDIHDDVVFTASQAFHLFHILSEAVNNAVKHSGGNKILVQIKSGGYWSFCIDDNGSGFNYTEVKKGNGLQNMQTRAKEMDWKIKWKHKKPGTSVCISNTPN